MDLQTAQRLNRLNVAFYQQQGASFSATRQAGWPGWDRCLDEALPAARADAARGSVRVLDLACGNLRFARYLVRERPGLRCAYDAVDDNRALAEGVDLPAGWALSFRQADVVEALLEERSLDLGGGHDLVVCFGFLHHVPTEDARRRLLRELVGATRPGGTCCVSFWRFMSDERMAARARATTQEGCTGLGLPPEGLEDGDYLLGWQGQPGVYRYCHHFDEDEVERLAAGVRDLTEVGASFCADGRTGSLNRYLVLRRRAGEALAAAR